MISPLSQQTPSSSFSSEASRDHEDYRIFQYVNDFEEVRLKLVKGKLDLNLPEDRDLCIKLYQKWVTDDNYMVLRKIDPRGPIEYQVCKARKRGNDVDAYRIHRQLRIIKDSIVEYAQSNQRLRATRAVHVTGTIDPRLVDNDLEYAWQYLGYWFNMFLASLRKRCVRNITLKEEKEKAKELKIRVYRSWESHGSGWPHFHAILCFEGYSWTIFQDSKSRWRLNDKDTFQDAWSFGWIDVVALTPGTTNKNVEKVVSYVSKYVGKGATEMDYRHVESWPRKRLLTESLLWYFGKRSYSISRGLLEGHDHPNDLKKRISTIQTNIEGECVPELEIVWEFIGMVRGKDTELDGYTWVKTYTDPPDWLDLCWKPCRSYVGTCWMNTWGS